MTTLKGSFLVGVLIFSLIEFESSVSGISPLSDLPAIWVVSTTISSTTISFSTTRDETGDDSSDEKVVSGTAGGVCVGIVAIWVVRSATIDLVVVVIISSLEGFPKEVSVELQATKR